MHDILFHAAGNVGRLYGHIGRLETPLVWQVQRYEPSETVARGYGNSVADCRQQMEAAAAATFAADGWKLARVETHCTLRETVKRTRDGLNAARNDAECVQDVTPFEIELCNAVETLCAAFLELTEERR